MYVFVKIFSFWGDNSLDLPTYGMRFYGDFVTYTSRVANLKLSWALRVLHNDFNG